MSESHFSEKLASTLIVNQISNHAHRRRGRLYGAWLPVWIRAPSDLHIPLPGDCGTLFDFCERRRTYATGVSSLDGH